jgi:hypothetical protein
MGVVGTADKVIPPAEQLIMATVRVLTSLRSTPGTCP